MSRLPISLGIVCLGILAACSQGPSFSLQRDGATDRIRVSDGVRVERERQRLRYRGELTENGLDALKSLAAGSEIKVLEIDSAGGEIVVGMDFGLWIHERGLDVEVNRACLSSCANYVFPAGRHKLIGPGAVVAWHGSARQAGLLEQMHASVESQISGRARSRTEREREIAQARKANERYLTDAIHKQARFFHLIGVDEYVALVGNEVYGVRGFFYLSVEDMARFGIDRVSAPEDYARMDPRALARRAGFPVTYVKLQQ